MTIDTGVMASAFEAGAGFSATDCRVFIVTFILIVAVFWSMVMLVGWYLGVRQAKYPAEYFMTRLMFLGILLVMVSGVLFFSGST